MSVQTALTFIQQLRTDETLKARLCANTPTPELDVFVKLGADIDLSFTVEELVTAHKYDWGMRWAAIAQKK